MFSCKLKFLIEILKKWLGEKFFQRFNKLDLFSKQRFKSENLICWEKTKFTICEFNLALTTLNAAKEYFTPYFGFVVAKKMLS